MRPAEVCGMTLNQIERGAEWTYFPSRHKTAYRGLKRVVPLGPLARTVLSEFLAGRALEPDEPIFSPKRAREERDANRKTRVTNRNVLPRQGTGRFLAGFVRRGSADGFKKGPMVPIYQVRSNTLNPLVT